MWSLHVQGGVIETYIRRQVWVFRNIRESRFFTRSGQFFEFIYNFHDVLNKIRIKTVNNMIRCGSIWLSYRCGSIGFR